MITITQIADVIQSLYNNISKTNTNISITISSDLRKYYGSYGTLPSNVVANIKEIACTPIGVGGVVSYQTAYNIEMLVPENYVETNENIWKSLQMQYQGRLVDLTPFTSISSSYTLKLVFEDCIESNYTTRSNGNTKVVSIIVRANVDQSIVNGSFHNFALVTSGNVEYNVPFTRFEFGEAKTMRAGNFGTDGRIGNIAQSQTFSCTLYCVLPNDNFWKNVVLPIILNFTGYEMTLKIGIDGTTYVKTTTEGVTTDNRASIPVIVNVLNYSGNTTDGIICALQCVYKG